MKKYDNKKEEILEAATNLFAVYGYAKTTLDDIAKMLGMKKTSLYYYFESKEQLFREIITMEIHGHFAEQEKILAKKIKASKKIEEILIELMYFVRQRAMKYSVRLETYLEFGRIIRTQFPELRARQLELLKKLIEEGIKNGEFKKVNAHNLAEDLDELVLAMINNAYIVSGETFIRNVKFEPIVKKIKRVIKYVLEGIKINKG